MHNIDEMDGLKIYGLVCSLDQNNKLDVNNHTQELA